MSVHTVTVQDSTLADRPVSEAGTKTIMIVGGTGVFGRRLADHLAADVNAKLIVTSRSRERACSLAGSLREKYPDVEIDGLGLDCRTGLAGTLEAVRPFLVIDASGPFQHASYDVAGTALSVGSHCIDLADARDYLAGYRDALEQPAQRAGCVARCGASSTPALSMAAVSAITRNWKSIDTVDICITPGGRAQVGRAVVEAVLSYAGKPVPLWNGGRLESSIGWFGATRMEVPGLGWRRVAPVETFDAELMGGTFNVTDRVAFHAGLENPVEQRGMEFYAWLVQKGLRLSAHKVAPVLHALRSVTQIGMSDAGGMVVKATGRDANNDKTLAQWSLLAEAGEGPFVPTLAASALARKILAGLVEPGAGQAADVLTLDDIEAEMPRYAISVHRAQKTI